MNAESLKEYRADEDRVIVTIPLADLGAADLGEALAMAIRQVAFPARLLLRPEASFDDIDAAYTNRYELIFDRGDQCTDESRWTSERRFFELCAEHSLLHSLMKRYFGFVLDAGERLGIGPIWHDDTHPAGCFALVPLLKSDRENVPLLLDFLLRTDLDEETLHSNLVRLVIATHGWSKETFELMAARIAMSHGQWAQDDAVAAVDTLGLLEALDTEARRDLFLDRVLRWARRSSVEPSLPLGVVAYVFGRGDLAEWGRWAKRAGAAHQRELTLAEPGEAYAELRAAAFDDQIVDPENWDEMD